MHVFVGVFHSIHAVRIYSFFFFFFQYVSSELVATNSGMFCEGSASTITFHFSLSTRVSGRSRNWFRKLIFSERMRWNQKRTVQYLSVKVYINK